MKLGIIGTGWIAKQFVDAALKTKKYELTAVYSRNLETAQKFSSDFPEATVEYFDELTEFFKSDSFDVVYIASPNSLHYAQAMAALKAQKNVIVEKPIVTNPKEMENLIAELRLHPKNYLFEAARHYHQPNFKAITTEIQGMEVIQGATLTYEKYSSRYDAYLAGEKPNVFTTDFAGGALEDLGVYLVYDALAWFGVPDSVIYEATKLNSGVDGSGIAILKYPQFNVTLQIGKTANSYLPGEIYGLKETLVMDNAADLNIVYVVDEKGNKEVISSLVDTNPLYEEAKAFAEVLENPEDLESRDNADRWLAMAVEVNKVLYKLRHYAKINFPNDVLMDED